MPDPIRPPNRRRAYTRASLIALAVAAVAAVVSAWVALVSIEESSRSAVELNLLRTGQDWAKVETIGLKVILTGDAPSETARFEALSAAGHVVDGTRVVDAMVLPDAVALEPPRFAIEMLRNEAGISLIGLVPEASDRQALSERVQAFDPGEPVADFLETADHPVPEGWDSALDFALDVAATLPRSKISVDATHVAIEAIAESADQKRNLEQGIRQKRPGGLRLALDIRAPLDVVAPFILRFLSDDEGTRFDACTAYTTRGRLKIVSAGVSAGVKGAVDCTIGLGVPSPQWPDAVVRGIAAVREMGGGSLTFSDADITLIAPSETPQDLFDRVTGELEADLPEVFSLHSVLAEPETGPARPEGPQEFAATLSGDTGRVQLRGRVAGEQDRTVIETLARARFGTEKVYAPLVLDPGLPGSWSVRVLAGLEALDQLAEGRVLVRPDVVTISGTTGDRAASTNISRLLSEQLGDAEDFRVNVIYEEALDPVAALPTPEECVADVNAVLAKSKISFAPGAAEIDRISLATVDKIADILKTCPDVAMEIGGYTDSQGRAEMNQVLSQRRAESVVSALLARRVLTSNLKAFGFGEDFPIADNDTEEGREANRRIEFKLVGVPTTTLIPQQVAPDTANIRPPSRPTVGEDEVPAEEPPVEETPAEDAAEDEAAAASVPESPETAPVETVSTASAPTEDATTEPEADAAPSPEQPDGDVAEADGADGAEATAAPEDTAEASTTDPEGEAETLPETSTPEEVVDAAPVGDVTEPDTEAPDAETSDDTGTAEAEPADIASVEPETEPEVEAPEAGREAADSADAASDTVEPAEDPVVAEVEAPASADLATEADAAEAEVDASSEVSPADTAEVAVAETPETAPETDPAEAAPVETAEAPDAAAEPTALDAETPAETAPDADADAEADTETAVVVLNPSDFPNIRPRPRPALVVHPELAGVRPRPRPASVPAETSQE